MDRVHIVCPWCFRELRMHKGPTPTGWRLIEHSRPDSEGRCPGSGKKLEDRIYDLEHNLMVVKQRLLKRERELREVRKAFRRDVGRLTAAVDTMRHTSRKLRRLCTEELCRPEKAGL